tara:strand:- start:1826 stop:2119 length:294 start_codon:yes stop_codon:yes gene_type:complete
MDAYELDDLHSEIHSMFKIDTLSKRLENNNYFKAIQWNSSDCNLHRDWNSTFDTAKLAEWVSYFDALKPHISSETLKLVYKYRDRLLEVREHAEGLK